ncbi:hypothetical protein D3C72_951600 [compost metagenome]
MLNPSFYNNAVWIETYKLYNIAYVITPQTGIAADNEYIFLTQLHILQAQSFGLIFMNF